MNYRNPTAIRKAGMFALQKELGTVGAVYFLRQFEGGSGNYTEERKKFLDGITLDEAIQSVKEFDIQHIKSTT